MKDPSACPFFQTDSEPVARTCELPERKLEPFCLWSSEQDVDPSQLPAEAPGATSAAQYVRGGA